MAKFPHKLNEWIIEEKQVEKVVPVEENGKVRLEKQMVTIPEKTMYIDAPSKKVMCSPGEHYFFCIDKHKYIFACRHCTFKRQVFPTTYRYEDGALIHLETGEKV